MEENKQVEEDFLWSVQLDHDSEVPPFAPDPTTEYQDNALLAGETLNPQSFAGVLGSVRKISVPFPLNDKDNNHHDCSRLAQLTLSLREVNGEGVISGVGGDVWCAALLMSTWLLANPEVVRGLNVLELGSGLGLCGIVSGYLARDVTLTDYVDELLLNLRYNIQANCTPKVEAIDSLRSPHEFSPKSEVQEVCFYEGLGTSHGSSTEGLPSVPRGRQEEDSSRVVWEEESTYDKNMVSHRLLPLSKISVRKLDWTAFSGASDVPACSIEDDWLDNGVLSTESGPSAKEEQDVNLAGSRVPPCDVTIGSALIYSPHHACVADVLQNAFLSRGCRAAHIIQLSTRPGFDEFLRRIRSCGLQYRLQRIASVLPPYLRHELRQRLTTAVVGGPIFSSMAGQAAMDSSDGYTAEFDDFVLCTISLCHDDRGRGNDH